ncbi:hypothetical protein EBZ39_16500 [bacterium]|nr:hypothetical protein [bacterium]
MVSQFGMSEMGPINYNTTQEHPYLGRDIQTGREFSERTAQLIDEEVTRLVNACYAKGKQLLEENRDKLTLLAEKLIEQETLQAHEVYELLGLPPRESHSFFPHPVAD